jgi:hypothetical protein
MSQKSGSLWIGICTILKDVFPQDAKRKSKEVKIRQNGTNLGGQYQPKWGAVCSGFGGQFTPEYTCYTFSILKLFHKSPLGSIKVGSPLFSDVPETANKRKFDFN